MSGTQVLIQTTGWNPDTGQDEDLGLVCISMMLPISATEGKWFSRDCKTPEELWDVLRNLDVDNRESLKNILGYSGPPKPPPPKSADALLAELEGL